MASSKSIWRGQFPSSCKLCNTETKLSWKCIDCDILMCNKCKDNIHPNLRNARKHKVIDIKEIGLTGEEVYFSNIPCKEHKGQVSVMFCKSCDQLVCTKCIAKIHNGHGLVEISEGYLIKIERLKERQNKLKIKDKDKIKRIKKSENEKYMKVKKQIEAQNIKLKKEVDLYTETLSKELNETWKTLLNSIEEEESKVATQEKMVRNIEDIIQSRDVEKILKLGHQEAEELSEYNFTSMPSFIPGEITQSNVGSFQHTLTDFNLQHTSTDISLKVIKEYATDISRVGYMSSSKDCLWVSDEDALQRVKPYVKTLKAISNFNIEIRGMAVTPSDDLLLVPAGESVLKKIGSGSNKVTYTNYSVRPHIFTAVHVTKDNKVIVGIMDFGEPFPVTGRRAVISMNKEGIYRTVYECDRYNQRIFTLPASITSTHSGNVCVVDTLSFDGRGRVVVLGQDGNIINIYNGHSSVNTEDKPFSPVSIVTTPSDSTIIPDMDTHTLHILNPTGYPLTYINTMDKGIKHPYSVTFTTGGNIYIGCSRSEDSTDTKAKLYEVKL